MFRNGLIYLSESSTAKNVVTKTPLRGMARRFVPGDSVEELIAAIEAANGEDLTVTANYLGEAETSPGTAREAGDRYIAVLERIAAGGLKGNVSVKFTQLGQAISEEFLQENLGRVLDVARSSGTFIRFDMESSEYTQRTLDAFERLWNAGWRDIGVVLQAYLFRSESDIARMNELGARVRLCKGAYAEPDEVAIQDRDQLDANFIKLMKMLLDGGTYPAIATHDDRMISDTVAYAARQGISPDAFEFQMLYGVRRDLQQDLITKGFNVRVYVPFGEAWYPYLMRRLAERPANMLFLAGSVVQESPLGFLWPKGKGGREG